MYTPFNALYIALNSAFLLWFWLYLALFSSFFPCVYVAPRLALVLYVLLLYSFYLYSFGYGGDFRLIERVNIPYMFQLLKVMLTNRG